jgi:hypothetical protein
LRARLLAFQLASIDAHAEQWADRSLDGYFFAGFCELTP